MASGQGPGPPRQECGKPALRSASEEQVAQDTEGFSAATDGTLRLQPRSTMGQVGRQLAITRTTSTGTMTSEFQTMLQRLQPRAENAYEYFTKIASSLFESGINRGRVVALLGFGYRLVLHVYQHSLTGFLGLVTRFVVFMLQHGIARWISQRGGWVAAPDLGNSPILNVLVVVGGVLLGQFVVRRFFKS
uniref:Bcl-2 Bcl-2 homology region 1-3 domain-containing protein n=1 Tax=Gorilla gorilla gorilla TaxID=9595 RepID=A0A2I2Y8H5_GORGO